VFPILHSVSLLLAVVAANPAPIRISAGRENTQATVTAKDESVTIRVECPFGIDRAKLERTGNPWPKQIVLQLHLKGLESFEAGNGQVTLLASVPSTGEPRPRLSLREGEKETELDQTSPYWTKVQVVADEVKIPLRDGYFQILLPDKLFEGNPASIQLHWIDFYRN
jgi:hypothetical protein